MPNNTPSLTPAAIKYLLALLALGGGERGVRSVELAAAVHVSKPSAHAMIRHLCTAGLAEKEHYGAVFLTPKGLETATLYRACFDPLCARMQTVLPLRGEACANAVCAVLSQISEELPRLSNAAAQEKECIPHV